MIRPLIGTLENGLAVRNIYSVLKHNLFHFVKPPSDTLLCYFMFHLVPSPSSLQLGALITTYEREKEIDVGDGF